MVKMRDDICLQEDLASVFKRVESEFSDLVEGKTACLEMDGWMDKWFYVCFISGADWKDAAGQCRDSIHSRRCPLPPMGHGSL